MPTIERQKDAALHVIRTLHAQGHTAYFAGGCVRDELLGRTPKDYDVATDARPEVVESLFPKTIPIGKAFGVIAVVHGKETVEVATFRKDVGHADGRRPDDVEFCAAREDALRRDFTINGMFYDPLTETLHDFVGGRDDLQRRCIRAIGHPAARFSEDHLRMLRAVRFAGNLDFSLDQKTAAAIRSAAADVRSVSAERIEQELTRLLTDSARPGDALKQLHPLRLMEQVLPEIIPLIGQEQPPQFHPEGDVFEHTCLMLNLMKSDPPCDAASAGYTARELAYTVLLHDVGKPPTARMGLDTEGRPRIRFHGHAQVGAELAEKILIRLRLPNRERRHIVDAVRGHMRFMEVRNMRRATLRKLIGSSTFDLEMELHRLDCLGSHAKLDNYEFVRETAEQMENEPALPEPWITGRDLMEHGIPEGKRIGKLLKKGYDAQLDDRFSSREELLDWLLKSSR